MIMPVAPLPIRPQASRAAVKTRAPDGRGKIAVMQFLQRGLAVLIAVTALAATGRAEPPAAASPPGDQLDAVLVTGERAGPGLWDVHRGSAHVWIMGIVAPLPKNITWRSAQFVQVLERANLVLIGRPVEINFVRILWLLITQRNLLMLQGGRKLKDMLRPDLYARFAAQRLALTGDDKKWERYRPIIAAAFLQETALHKVGLSNRLDLDKEVRELAAAHRVRVEEVKIAGVRDLLDVLKTLPPDTESKCVAAALSLVESGLPRLVERARAWTTGDIEGIESLPETAALKDCRQALDADSGAADLIAQNRRAWMERIDGSLRSGGVAVAVVNMDLLLERGGLLDELRAEGYAVDAP
jgi:uncharacterized protein YbaP (TraB family)